MIKWKHSENEYFDVKFNKQTVLAKITVFQLSVLFGKLKSNLFQEKTKINSNS